MRLFYVARYPVVMGVFDPLSPSSIGRGNIPAQQQRGMFALFSKTR